MSPELSRIDWRAAAVLTGRLIFALIFIMGVGFKLSNFTGTVSYIADAGFLMPSILLWLAVLLELSIIACFLTGTYFSEAALVASVYVLFLAFAFYGPSHWAGNRTEFFLFINHFAFIAGLLFAAAQGPGRILTIKHGWSGRR